MASKTKPQRLRAFRIENNEITQTNSLLLENLAKKLNGSKAENRRMQLNSEDIKRGISLDKIIENNIISAELLISFKKPRKMSNDDYQKILGAYMKPISDTDNITLNTKKHGKIKGSEINRTKLIDIELTETNKINEPQLYQEMEKFLNELKNEINN